MNQCVPLSTEKTGFLGHFGVYGVGNVSDDKVTSGGVTATYGGGVGGAASNMVGTTWIYGTD